MRWGTFALVDATRALLRAALADPANQRFVLLSESGIPLYPPAAMHQQLLAERRSRINACALPGVCKSEPAGQDTACHLEGSSSCLLCAPSQISVPLYLPVVVHQQLPAERRTRIVACAVLLFAERILLNQRRRLWWKASASCMLLSCQERPGSTRPEYLG